MKPVFTCLLIFMVLCARAQNARTIVSQSVEKTGMAILQQKQSLKLVAYGVQYAVEQSERPEGPFIPGVFSRISYRDIHEKRMLIKDSAALYNTTNQTNWILNNQYAAYQSGNRLYPAPQGSVVQDELLFAPEQVLFTALSANDLRLVKDTLLQQVPNYIIVFTIEKHPARIFISKETGFLTGVEITKPYAGNNHHVWGDMKKLVLYSFWNFIDRQIHYPLQADTYLNNRQYSTSLIHHWQVDTDISNLNMQIPPALITAIQQQKNASQEYFRKSIDENTVQLKEHIWLIRGACNTLVLEQPEGICVIEAGVSSGYASMVIDKIKQLCPGKNIKTLITTSDAWLHIGGIRSYAAIPGINIIYPARNKAILQQLLNASYTSNADALSGTQKKNFRLTTVTDSLTTGNGNLRIQLYTFRTESGERMMMAYLPGHQLLYTSDLYQPKEQDGNYWNTHIIWEVVQAVHERQLSVKEFIGMHTQQLSSFAALEEECKNF